MDMRLTVFQQTVTDQTHVLHYLLLPKRDTQLTGPLRSTQTYPTVYAKTSHFKNSGPPDVCFLSKNLFISGVGVIRQNDRMSSLFRVYLLSNYAENWYVGSLSVFGGCAVVEIYLACILLYIVIFM